jgi:exonuclease SbcD
VPVVTVGEKGTVSIELVPLKPKRDMRHIKGTIENLLDTKYIRESEDYMYVTLTNENTINDAMGIFQQYYPRTIKIDYENSHTREMEQVDISGIAENKSFTELIGEFYQMLYGCEMGDEEMDILRDAAEKAGVPINEAD